MSSPIDIGQDLFGDSLDLSLPLGDHLRNMTWSSQGVVRALIEAGKSEALLDSDQDKYNDSLQNMPGRETADNLTRHVKLLEDVGGSFIRYGGILHRLLPPMENALDGFKRKFDCIAGSLQPLAEDMATWKKALKKALREEERANSAKEKEDSAKKLAELQQQLDEAKHKHAEAEAALAAATKAQDTTAKHKQAAAEAAATATKSQGTTA